MLAGYFLIEGMPDSIDSLMEIDTVTQTIRLIEMDAVTQTIILIETDTVF
jgi:hypothetical protein